MSISRSVASVLALASIGFVCVPARAETVSGLQSEIGAALRSAKSFTLAITPGTGAVEAGGRITYVVVEPGRFHQVFTPSPGAAAIDTIVIGDTLYDRPDNGAFHFTAFSKERQTPFLAPLFDVRIVALAPDTLVNGTPLGTYVAVDPLANDPAVTMTCTYDKGTYRPMRCAGTQTQLEYGRYDDPTLSVDVPPGALPYP